jgi:hypothetical protein
MKTLKLNMKNQMAKQKPPLPLSQEYKPLEIIPPIGPHPSAPPADFTEPPAPPQKHQGLKNIQVWGGRRSGLEYGANETDFIQPENEEETGISASNGHSRFDVRDAVMLAAEYAFKFLEFSYDFMDKFL